MYVIIVYDVEGDRCDKAKRLCRRYLHHVQNSVFEGEITEAILRKVIIRLEEIANTGGTVRIYEFRSPKDFKLHEVGSYKSSTSQFI